LEERFPDFGETAPELRESTPIFGEEFPQKVIFLPVPFFRVRSSVLCSWVQGKKKEIEKIRS
jgi:hypothetical protein